MHLTGLVLSIVGTLFLVWHCWPDTARMATTAIFGITMCGCFLSSSLHHLVKAGPATEFRLLKLDHAAIYPFIAGTYTPICVHLLPAPGGLIVLALVWIIAVVGVVHKFWFEPDPANVSDPPSVKVFLPYLGMGWLAAPLFPSIIAQSQGMTILLPIIGGAAYTIGGIILTKRLFDFWPGKLGHHELWHACVLLGSACLYSYVFLNVA